MPVASRLAVGEQDLSSLNHLTDVKQLDYSDEPAERF